MIKQQNDKLMTEFGIKRIEIDVPMTLKDINNLNEFTKL